MRVPRYAILFFLALALPCVVLVLVGVRMIRNGDELATKHEVEERDRLAQLVASELLGGLERIKLEAASDSASRHPDVAMMGWLTGGRLVLPWQTDAAVARFRQVMLRTDTPFSQALATGERNEMLLQFERAHVSYQRAVDAATGDEARDYARLLRARVLVKCKCPEDARPIYESLLGSTTRDDEGVPLALYAAHQLLEAQTRLQPKSEPRLISAVERVAADHRLSPSALHLAHRILASLAGTTTTDGDRVRRLMAEVEATLADQTRAVELQSGLPTALAVPRSPRAANDVWIPVANGAWLASQAPSSSGQSPLVVAVRVATITASVEARLTASTIQPGTLGLGQDPAAGAPLGDAFPGVRVSFTAANATTAAAWAVQRRFYVTALLLVIGVTLVGGLFVWRSVRRELRLAELRAQFVASVSHELKTPLTAIRMFAETLQMKRPLDQAGRAEYLDTIVNESERLSRLINNVLDYSQIERGQKVYHLEAAPLGPVVLNAARTMQYPLHRLGFGLRVDVPVDGPALRIDADAIEQAVLNLLSNAVKYSRDRREIDLRLASENGHAVIEVTDYGLGIPPAEQHRIFERFYRAPVPENGRIAGAGLGLSLVDHIVKAHGGLVELRSVPGQGSTFAIHLPLTSSRLEAAF